MLRRRSIRIGLWGVVAAASLSASACTDDGVSLHIECNASPDVSDTGCTWAADGECTVDGRMNLRGATSYYAAFRVASALKSRKSTSPPRSEPNGIQLREAEVELRSPDGRRIGFPNGLPNPYTLVSSGYVPPESTGLIQLELVPPAYVDGLRVLEQDASTAIGQLIASIKVRGKTDGQVEIQTAAFDWPIRLVSKSPIAEDGECFVSEDGFCTTLAGVDAFSETCLCGASAAQGGGACDLGSD